MFLDHIPDLITYFIDFFYENLFKIYRTAINRSENKTSKNMLPSVNNDGTPKHDECMTSHARKRWALQARMKCEL